MFYCVDRMRGDSVGARRCAPCSVSGVLGPMVENRRLQNRMTNLLFDTPWWLPTLLAGVGIVLFWNGNRTQETRLRNIGMALMGAAVLVCAISYFIDTDLEKCVKQSKQLA